jgi:NAD(P)-dependent dehydrogenase (short-subunit alcohol dehydrogenase family)
MTTEVLGRRFDGKVAIVTGSSANPSIGRSTARRLAREGASVVINGRSKDQLMTTEKELRDEGLDVVAVHGSAEDDDMPARLVDAALEAFGRVDLLANTIGGTRHAGPWEQLDRATLLDTFAINTWPALALVQEAVKRGLAEGGGAVVNISSGSPKKTTPAMLSYAAAKAALNAMTRTLARDLGPRGIRVNAVAPGLTMTTATRSFWEGDGGASAGTNLVLGRLPDAEDIANAVVFLLSEEAKSITGLIVDVDGGDHLMASSGWSPFQPGGPGLSGETERA